ncbi:EF-hand domain-containing protein [Marinobacter sp. 2_MG-2023]|uniref:EF-hand domain-containing protein n=1 Tax=Marinobacter sp. 2_MG-2023 TaxID=3062679 RepID=UPI0026E408FF|nr:EF-hand domain-containing protein [Marinobacter sp. 2_MG-2023]MDO6441766.1 EF-hand domain-containing protein [Marinobacter sp. 2_MG-2023]
MFGKLILSIISLTLLVPGLAFAQETRTTSPDTPNATAQQMGGPNDAGGHASSHEAGDDSEKPGKDQDGNSSTSLRFDELDANKDGKLEAKELNKYRKASQAGESENPKKQGERLIELYDHDGDGTISRKELNGGMIESERN